MTIDSNIALPKAYTFQYVNPPMPQEMEDMTVKGWMYTAFSDKYGALFRREIKRVLTPEQKEKRDAEMKQLAKDVRWVMDENDAALLPVYRICKHLLSLPAYSGMTNGVSPDEPGKHFINLVTGSFIGGVTIDDTVLRYFEPENKVKKFPRAKRFIQMTLANPKHPEGVATGK